MLQIGPITDTRETPFLELSQSQNNHSQTVAIKTRHRALVDVARTLGKSQECLNREFKAAKKRGDNFIVIGPTENGIDYLIEWKNGFYSLSVRYSEKTPVCYIYFEFEYRRLSKIYNAFEKTIVNFIKIFKEVLTVHYKIPAYLYFKHWDEPHGIRMAVIGANSDDMAAPLASIARAMAATGARCDIRIVDHQRGDV